jgi:hypothetical protein
MIMNEYYPESKKDPAAGVGAPGEPSRLAEELKAIPFEPLLPIEKKLIAGSLLLGISLLGVLYWLSHTYFPVVAGGG